MAENQKTYVFSSFSTLRASYKIPDLRVNQVNVIIEKEIEKIGGAI